MAKLFSIPVPRWKSVLFLGDFFCFFTSFFLCHLVDQYTSAQFYPYHSFLDIHFFLIGAIYFLILYIADVYDYQQDFCKVNNLIIIAVAGSIGTLVVMFVYYFLLGSFLNRWLLLIQAVVFIALLCLWRYLFSARLFTPSLFKRTIIIGAGGAGRRILEIIREYPRCGLIPVGFVDDDAAKVGTQIDGLPVLGTSSQLSDLVETQQASLAVVAITHQKKTTLINQLIKACWQGCYLIDMPSIYEAITGRVPTSHISDDWLYQWNLNSLKLYYRRLKRLFDLLLASLCFLVSFPLFLIIALAIKLDSPGPVFFYQERLGLDRRPFRIVKFRTMIYSDDQDSQIWTDKDDSRLTRVGRFIRRVRLDELPQFFNIFRGEMSFIGPRPLVHCDYKETIPYYNYRFLVRPGITGWAQVAFPQGLAEEDTLEKVKYDIYYIKNLSFLLDIAIFLKTIRIVLFGQGH